MLPKTLCDFTADIHNLLEPNTYFAVKWSVMFVMGSVFVLRGFQFTEPIKKAAVCSD
jgi:hypothetical protein